jgi:hypothetical protein
MKIEAVGQWNVTPVIKQHGCVNGFVIKTLADALF